MRNCSSSSIRLSTVVKVLYFTTSQWTSYILFASSTIFIILVPPSVLDGGPHILLANMLSPKRLVCSGNSHMAQPIPYHAYVLVNRSILCNCHLQSGLTYLLKSLASFTMYFTVNASFQHYMALYDLSQDTVHTNSLLPQEHSFNIFLNETHPSPLHFGNHPPAKPLDSPTLLQTLIQSIEHRPQTSQNLPFFPTVWHTNDKILPDSTKGSFWFSTICVVPNWVTSVLYVW